MTYAVIHDDLPTHRKIMEAGGDAAWLYVAAICYCSRNLTDGRFPRAILGQLTDRKNPGRLARRLVDVGLWEEQGHDHYAVHDYLKYQRSRAQVDAIREKNVENGRKGGQAKHTNRGASEPPSDALSEPVGESLANRQAHGLATGLVAGQASVHLSTDVDSPPPQTFVAPDGAEEDDRSAKRLKALAEASLARFEATGGVIHTSREGWLRTERKRRTDENDWADPEPLPNPQPVDEHPADTTARAQRQEMDRNAARKANPCRTCSATGWVEPDIGDGVTPCRACGGTGVAA